MRLGSLVFTLIAVCVIDQVEASEIREFELQTIELLGRQLYEHRNQSAKSLSERQGRGVQVAKGALSGRIDQSYKFVVLNDPDGSGFLVFALATSKVPSDVVLGIHYRVTVSADAKKVERVDALSRSAIVMSSADVVKGYHSWGFSVSHIVSRTPLETHVYATLLYKTRLAVATMDRTVWGIENGKIRKL
jgi:hypothetical protein